MKIFNKKLAYTLSEVMVTLALIGCIATLTLATVGASVQQRAKLAEFRAAYAKLETALRSVSTLDGKIFGCYVCPSETEINEYGLNMDAECVAASNDCIELNDNFVRAMGATRFCENNPIKEGCLPENYPKSPDTACFQNFGAGSHAYVLDNSMILFDDGGKYLRQFAIDVNGRKGPNKWGQDIFTFAVKVVETAEVAGVSRVVDVSILPPSSCLPGKSDSHSKNATQSSDQLLKESTNYR